MITLRKAAQQALEALEQSETTVRYEGFGMAHREAERKHQAAITVLRAALEEPGYPLGKATTDVGVPVYVVKKTEPVQEPVAWMHTNAVGDVYFRKKPQDKVFNPQPVYTVPVGCPNCASLEAQNTELDRKLAELEESNADELTVAYTIGAHSRMRTLTDEVIAELWYKNGTYHHHFARAIERWLKGEQ